jgi:hypothetical protein
MSTRPLYIVDTSSLINLQLWRPLGGKNSTAWNNLDRLIRDDRLISSEQVCEELRGVHDALRRWALRHKKARKCFTQTDGQHLERVQKGGIRSIA